MMDMMSSSRMEEQFIARQNWKSENVLHKTTKVLHKTPDSVFDIVNIGLHFFHKDVRLYAASCSEV